MKQKMLQMFVSIYGDLKKIECLLAIIRKFIKKYIGAQKQGKRRWNLTKIILGILYYLKSGCQWRLLPIIFGKWRTVYGWYRIFTNLEIFKKIWTTITQYADSIGTLNTKNVLGDGSLVLTVSSIQIKSKNPRMKSKNCINRLILTDQNGFALSLLIAKGTAHDTTFLIPLIDLASNVVSLPKNFIAHEEPRNNNFFTPYLYAA